MSLLAEALQAPRGPSILADALASGPSVPAQDAPPSQSPPSEGPGPLARLAIGAIPTAGSVLGYAAGSLIPLPGAGPVGGGVGGAAGELIKEEIEKYEGMRSEVSPAKVSLEGVLGTVSFLGNFPAVRGILARAFLRGAEGAGLSAAGDIGTNLIDRKELPPASEILKTAAVGLAVGGAFGSVEGIAAARKAAGLAASEANLAEARGALPEGPVEVPLDVPPERVPLAVAPVEPSRFAAVEPSPVKGTGPEMERKFVTNLKESGAVGQEILDPLSETGSYFKRAEDQLSQEALNRLKADPTGEVDRLLTEGIRNDLDVRIAGLAAKKATQEGRTGTAVDLYRTLAQFGTATGRATQAFAAIKDNLGSDLILPFTLSNIRRAGGEILGPEVADELVKMAQSIEKMPEGREKDLAQAALLTKSYQQVPSSFSAKFLEAWRGMLLSTGSVFAKGIGDTTLALMRPLLERPIRAGLQAVKAGAGRVLGIEVERQRLFGEIPADLVGAWQGLKDGWREGVDILLYQNFGKSVSDSALDIQAPAIKGITGYIVRTPFRALEAVTTLAKSLNRSAELSAQAYRKAVSEGYEGADIALRAAELRANPTQPMLDAANKEAAYRTFTAPLKSKLAKSTAEWIYNNTFTQFIAPFYKVPINAEKLGLTYNPLYALGLVYKGITHDPSLAGAGLTDETAKLLIGILAASSTVALVKEGYLTGAGTFDRNGEKILRMAEQQYSTRIGDRYYSYNKFFPFSVPMALTADVVENWDRIEKEDAALVLATSFANVVTHHLFWTGFSALNNAISDPNRYGQSYAQRIAGSIIPNVLARAASAIDPRVKAPDTIFQAIEARVPFLGSEIPAIRDYWGREVIRAGTAPEIALAPYTVSAPEPDPTLDEVIRVGKETGLWPSSPRRNVVSVLNPDGKILRENMPQDEYDHYVETSGGKAKIAVTRLVSQPWYARLTDEQKARAIQQQFSDARAETLYQMGVTQENDKTRSSRSGLAMR